MEDLITRKSRDDSIETQDNGTARCVTSAEGHMIRRTPNFLIENQAVVSGVGFIFWVLAARFYSTAEVGRGTAVLAAGTFVAILATWRTPSYSEGSGSPNLAELVRGSPVPLSSSRRLGCAVVVLNWNGGAGLIRCLESVTATTPSWVRVIVTDNGSTDGSPEAAAQIPRVEVWRNGTNMGFAAAYNRTIRRCSEAYVVVLNPDTVVEGEGWVERLIAVAERDPAIAVVGCTLVFDDDSGRINSAGGMVYWWTGPVDFGFGELDTGAFRVGHEPFAASGGAMLIRRDPFLKIGGFDEPTFLYIEDVDLCWRLRLRRLKIGFAPDVSVRHAFSTSFGALSVRKVYLTHRNYLRTMLRNYSASTLAWALPAYGMWSALKIVGALAIERSPALASGVIRALGWNAVVLGDTLYTRRAIQSGRMIDDRTIRRQMGPLGFEPRESLRRRWAIAHGRMPRR